MLKGIYRAASGMIPRVRKQEVISNNIANATTPGFKKDALFLKELSAARRKMVPTGSVWQTPMIDQVYTDYGQGALEKTGDNLTAAIEGPGFFVLDDAESGRELFTRNGKFMVSSEGYLTSAEGYLVRGDGGPIEVSGGETSISESGDVIVNDAVVGRLQVVDFEDPHDLQKAGESNFVAPPEAEARPADGYSIRNGYLEKANINIVKEMVEMIVSYRQFEAGQKAIQIQDESLNRLMNDVARTRL
jgi:flagellar basal-body rod protein FlgF